MGYFLAVILLGAAAYLFMEATAVLAQAQSIMQQTYAGLQFTQGTLAVVGAFLLVGLECVAFNICKELRALRNSLRAQGQ